MKNLLVAVTIFLMVMGTGMQFSSNIAKARNRKELQFRLIRQNVINQADAEWKATYKRIKKDLDRIQREIDAYIHKQNQDKNNFNILATAARYPDLTIKEIPTLKRAKELKRAIRRFRAGM
jgi:predicted  nucleic acid-binding Zn-ribbon protein